MRGSNPERKRHAVAALGWLALVLAAQGPFLVSAMLVNDGRFVAPLDDAYIHLQYARSVAEGHPFAYSPGAPPSSGASSLTWVLLLAPFELVGLGLLGSVLLGVVASAFFLAASRRFARRVGLGRVASYAVPFTLASWGWLQWHLASGMEAALCAALVMAMAGELARFAVGGEEGRRSAVALAWLGLLLPLTRQEATGFALLASLLLTFVRGRRALALFPLLGVVAPPLFWWWSTGSSRTNGAAFKWVFAMPYETLARKLERIEDNGELGLGYLLGDVAGNRRDVLVPYAPAGLAALGLLVSAARRASAHTRLVRTLLLGAFAAAFFAVATSTHFDTHRARYLFPFAPLLVVLLVAAVEHVAQRWLSVYASRSARVTRDRRALAGWLAAPLAIAAFVPTYETARRDYARASFEIGHQHVEMAAAIRELPADARIALNDAGVLAYLGERATFDLVGLTTQGNVPYYLGGLGSEHEMLERLTDEEYPTHFVIYPHWWNAHHVLGRTVHASVVPEPTTIVGGARMELREAARRGASTDAPENGSVDGSAVGGSAVDGLDVADLESEEAHGYRCTPYGWVENRLHSWQRGSTTVRDGGRDVLRERFEARAAGARLVHRYAASHPVRMRVRVDGVWSSAVVLPANAAGEVTFEVAVRGGSRIETSRDRPAASLHWWVVE